jgi:hypothetical protein
MGRSIDSIFAFYTTKLVAIQDRSLGILRMIFMFSIFCYIIIYKMWYQGIHFEESEVEGLSRQEWQEPTQGWCNPRHLDCSANYTHISDLQYCRQYVGGMADRVQRPCKYFDARELPITLSNGVLIPTYIQKFQQSKDCQDLDEHCERKYHFVDEWGLPQKGAGIAEPHKRHFVAGVEDFTLTLDHSFRTTDGKVAYDDFLMDGKWSVCDKDLNRQDPNFHKQAAVVPRQRHCETKPIKCIHWKCLDGSKKGVWSKITLLQNESSGTSLISGGACEKGGGSDCAHNHLRAGGRGATSRKGSTTRGDLRSREFLEIEAGEAAADALAETAADDAERPTPAEMASSELSGDKTSVVAMKGGDVLTLKTLLAMAGESLDEIWQDEDEGSLSLRLRGTALMVNIHYTNVQHWALLSVADPPWYTISVTSRPAHKFMHAFVSHEYEDKRELTWAYGVYVIVKQTGHIRTFNSVTALMTLTSALVLLGMGDMFVSMLAAYVMPKKAKYRALMYQVSDEMGEVDSDSESGREEGVQSAPSKVEGGAMTQ